MKIRSISRVIAEAVIGALFIGGLFLWVLVLDAFLNPAQAETLYVVPLEPQQPSGMPWRLHVQMMRDSVSETCWGDLRACKSYEKLALRSLLVDAHFEHPVKVCREMERTYWILDESGYFREQCS